MFCKPYFLARKSMLSLLTTKRYFSDRTILIVLHHNTGKKTHCFFLNVPFLFSAFPVLPWIFWLLFVFFHCFYSCFHNLNMVEKNSGYGSQFSFLSVILLNHIIKTPGLYINSMQINFRSSALASLLSFRLSNSITYHKLLSKYFASSTNSKLWDNFSHL